MYKSTTGLPTPAQTEAFCDPWEMTFEKSELASDVPRITQEYGVASDTVHFWHYMIEALKMTDTKLLAYLVSMTVRIVEMCRILKPTGSPIDAVWSIDKINNSSKERLGYPT